MASPDVLIENRGPASWITLNRPEVLNALRPATYAALIRAIDTAEADRDTRFVVITGAGRAFCAGDDVSAVFQADEPLVGSESAGRFDSYRQPDGAATPTVASLLRCTKPTIAAINGAAVGMGLDIALLCDLRVAVETAKLGSLFVRRGFCGTVAGSVLLPRIIGMSRAMELLLSGETITAKEAEPFGLFSRVVAENELDKAVEELIVKLCWGAPLAQRAIKKVVRRGLGVDLLALEEYTRLLSDPLWDSDDHREGVAAFVERRPPEYQQR